MSGAWKGIKGGDWWAGEEQEDLQTSSCVEVSGAYFCTRGQGHPGRHIATIGRGLVAVKAWPGTHEPTAEDLS